jgi:hypothetical protein
MICHVLIIIVHFFVKRGMKWIRICHYCECDGQRRWNHFGSGAMQLLAIEITNCCHASNLAQI